MKKLFFILGLLPQFAFGGSILLILSAEQGLSQLKLPGEITFESTNVFCEERGLLPMPWSAPRKQKATPKIISLSGNTVVLEINTVPKKQDICKYKFAHFTTWSDDAKYFFSIDAFNNKGPTVLDAADLELTTNQNSLYTIECVQKGQNTRACKSFKDGVRKGYGAGNGVRFTVDLDKLEAQKEIRATFDYKSRRE